MLTFLKLGGSLITDKDIPYSSRKKTIKRIGREILDFLDVQPDHHLLIGHGSGSFGHYAASKIGTIDGVHTPDEWLGFQSVWWAARQLNQIVCEIFVEIGLPIISLPASSALITKDRSISAWMIQPLEESVNHGLIPIIYGDVLFDHYLGGTIFSTEELFEGLTGHLHPARILLAGIDSGVYRDFPENMDLIDRISMQSFQEEVMNLQKSSATDVTGGMITKVMEMLTIVRQYQEIEIQIFSGENQTNIYKALSGEHIGTIISA